VLLLDEPLAAMGVKEARPSLTWCAAFKDKGISIIMIAHNYGQVLEVCDRVNLLQGGRDHFDKYRQDTSLEGADRDGRSPSTARPRGAPPLRLLTVGDSRRIDHLGHDGGHVYPPWPPVALQAAEGPTGWVPGHRAHGAACSGSAPVRRAARPPAGARGRRRRAKRRRSQATGPAAGIVPGPGHAALAFLWRPGWPAGVPSAPR